MNSVVVSNAPGIISHQELRKSMKLDFSTIDRKSQLNNNLLSSPDLNTIPSPYLERLILAGHFHQSLQTPTPTPTNALLFPRHVTEEQKKFAQGLDDALAVVRQRDGPALDDEDIPSVIVSNVQYDKQSDGPAVSDAQSPVTYAQLEPVSVKLKMSPDVSRFLTRSTHTPDSTALGQLTHPIKAEIDDSASSASTAGMGMVLSPVDLDHQEHIKLGRKRLRNRVAASKCRKRKLDRIRCLDDRIDDLKAARTRLGGDAERLRADVRNLSAAIAKHMEHGCQVRVHPALVVANGS